MKILSYSSSPSKSETATDSLLSSVFTELVSSVFVVASNADRSISTKLLASSSA